MRREHERLRSLARQVREIAELPVQASRRKLWTALNDLHAVRPMVFARGYTLDVVRYGEELENRIEEPFLSRYESDLLMRIYQWKHLQCDMVVEPVLDYRLPFSDSGFGIETGPETGAGTAPATDGRAPGSRAIAGTLDIVSGPSGSTARRYPPRIRTKADLDRLRVPEVSLDAERSALELERLAEVFEGILTIRVRGIDAPAYTPWDTLLTWFGIEEGMCGFLDDPELMEYAVEKLTGIFTAWLSACEAAGLLRSNNDDSIVGSGAYGYTGDLPTAAADAAGCRTRDMWGFIANQTFTAVSPGMHYRFATRYEKDWSDRFGLLYYGCCERLDHKIGMLMELGNLRKISCSPYSDLEAFAERAGRRQVVSFKPNSNFLAAPVWDVELSRAELVRACDVARRYGCAMEIVMKTIISLGGDPTRLWRWCDMASEIAGTR